MFHEVVRAVSNWRMGEIPGPWYDCVYVAGHNTPGIGMHDLWVACIHSFFSVRGVKPAYSLILQRNSEWGEGRIVVTNKLLEEVLDEVYGGLDVSG